MVNLQKFVCSLFFGVWAILCISLVTAEDQISGESLDNKDNKTNSDTSISSEMAVKHVTIHQNNQEDNIDDEEEEDGDDHGLDLDSGESSRQIQIQYRRSRKRKSKKKKSGKGKRKTKGKDKEKEQEDEKKKDENEDEDEDETELDDDILPLNELSEAADDPPQEDPAGDKDKDKESGMSGSSIFCIIAGLVVAFILFRMFFSSMNAMSDSDEGWGRSLSNKQDNYSYYYYGPSVYGPRSSVYSLARISQNILLALEKLAKEFNDGTKKTY